MKGRGELDGRMDEKNRCNEQRFGWQQRRMETADNRPLLYQIYLSYKQKNIVCLALPLRLTITYISMVTLKQSSHTSDKM